MHLAKLEQAGFLATGFRRAAGGGRPAKLYRLSDIVVTFGFPPRRYELLSRLALDALAAGGTRDDALRVCREAGAAEGRRALAGDAEPPRDRAAAAALVAPSPRSRACCPRWRGRTVRSASSSTTAASASSPGADPDLVCAMHRAFLEGILEVATAGLGRLRIDPGDCRISCGDQRCELLCSFAAGEE